MQFSILNSVFAIRNFATLLKGQRVLRVTVINPATTREHVERLIDTIRRVAS